jgi:copper transport protein
MRRAIFLLAVGTGLWLLVLPGIAGAHAALLRSEPAANAFVQRPPGQILLGFSEPVDSRQSGLQLLDASGRALAIANPDFSGAGTITVQLPALQPGIYNVLWFNLSRVDGHSLRGSFPFTILNADGSLPAQTNGVTGLSGDTDPPPLADGVAVRGLSLLGLLLVVAGALLIVLLPREQTTAHRGLGFVVYTGGALLIAASLLNLELIRRGYSSLALSDVVFHTRAGGYWLTRLGAAFLVAFLATMLGESPRRSGAGLLVGVGLYIWAFAATSHGAAGTGSAWGTGLDLVHGLLAVLWIGAVIGVAATARLAGRRAAYAELMSRFGLVASLLVFVLLGTGLLSSFIELSSPAQLTGTRYGWTLLLKLALLVPLLAVAGYNARWGRRRLEALAPGEPRRFIFTATAEVALGLAVITCAAFLTQTSVAKSVPQVQKSAVFDRSTTLGGVTVSLRIDPNQTGLNTYRVALKDATDVPIKAERVRLTFRYQDDQTVGPSTLDLASSSTAGQYSGQGPFLTLEGQWRVEVNVRRATTDDVTAFFDVRPAGTPFVSAFAGGRWDNPAPGLSWNEFAGIAVLMAGFGFALWREPIGAFGRWPGHGASVATILGFGLGSLLLFGVHKEVPSSALPANPVFPDQNSVETGKRLFQQNCVSCHGQTGVPPKGLDLNPYPLDLTVHVPQHADGQLFRFIERGVQGSAMKAWGEPPGALTDEQIWHLVNFLRTLSFVER